MSRGKRKSLWQVMHRYIAIVQRLVRSPASGQEIISFVRDQVGTEAYSQNPSAARQAFKRDRKCLWDRFGVRWEYDRVTNQYVLASPGNMAVLDLPDEQLAALHVLYSTFEHHESSQVPVKPLLDHIVDLLPGERQKALVRLARVMYVEMRELDEGDTPNRVWQKVKQATDQHRQLAFNYYSPQQADGLPRYRVVAPLELRFRRGHWYLLCWELRWHSHLGSGTGPTYRKLRLRYIADDDRLEVLPSKIAVAQRRLPRHFVHYLLKPPVGRGDISRHFDEMTVERQPDGSAVVKGFCDDAWDAVRTLLGYGENCIVLGGDRVLNLMRRRVRGMAKNYDCMDRS